MFQFLTSSTFPNLFKWMHIVVESLLEKSVLFKEPKMVDRIITLQIHSCPNPWILSTVSHNRRDCTAVIKIVEFVRKIILDCQGRHSLIIWDLKGRDLLSCYLQLLLQKGRSRFRWERLDWHCGKGAQESRGLIQAVSRSQVSPTDCQQGKNQSPRFL